MLSRMDANGNGQLDPEELQGPARFMLDRIGRDEPEIAKALSNNKPIPLSKITKAMESIRGGGSNGNSSRSGSPTPPPGSTAPVEPEPLVPGFGVKLDPKPIPGFGPEGADPTAAVKVEERDIKEAKERIERYDKNKDGILDEKEVAEGRWSDNPWAFDRNKDKKLTEQEMAVRYAKRRATEEAAKTQSASSDSRRSNDPRRGGDDRNRDRREKDEPPASPWSNQASYKYSPKNGQGSKVQGLPEWFSSGDVNGDGQVMMNEYASNWDDAIVAEFNKFDTNGDGSITTLEALGAVKKGLMRGAAAIAPSAGSSSPSPAIASASTTTTAAVAPPTNIDRSDLPEGADERWVKFVVSKIAKVDKDRNSRLTIDEWTPSDGDFKAIDTNGDGSISLGEFYKFKKK